MYGNRVHPFSGGIRKRNITQRHYPLIWECMLGTVYARDPVTGKIQYFDYNWDAARQHARVSECTDLRIFRDKRRGWYYPEGPGRNKVALYGIPPKQDVAPDRINQPKEMS